MKKSLLAYFEDNLTRGAALVQAEEEDAQEITEEMVDAICGNDGDGFARARKPSLKLLYAKERGTIKVD